MVPSNVLIVYKLTELSRSCSKRIMHMFELRLLMENFQIFIWKVLKKILFIKSLVFWKKNENQN